MFSATINVLFNDYRATSSVYVHVYAVPSVSACNTSNNTTIQQRYQRRQAKQYRQSEITF